jgi:hypothetical protein
MKTPTAPFYTPANSIFPIPLKKAGRQGGRKRVVQAKNAEGTKTGGLVGK